MGGRPVNIDMPSMLVQLRAEHVEKARATHRVPSREAVSMAAAAWIMSHEKRFAQAGRLSRARSTTDPLEPAQDTVTSPAVRLGRVAGRALSSDQDVPRLVAAHPRGRRPVMTSPRQEVLRRVRDAIGMPSGDVGSPAPVAREYRTSGDHRPEARG